MHFKGAIKKSEYILAIAIGSITGLIGFALFMIILHISSNQPVEEGTVVETAAPNSSISTIEMNASQYGVFSTKEGAEQFIQNQHGLEMASIVSFDGKFYVWKELVQSPTDSVDGTAPYWKQMLISNRCEQYPQLLEDFQNIYENYHLQQNDFLAKLPNEWQEIILERLMNTSVEGVWRAVVMAHDLSSTACLQLKFQ